MGQAVCAAQSQDDLIYSDAVQAGVAGDLGYAEAFVEQEMIFMGTCVAEDESADVTGRQPLLFELKIGIGVPIFLHRHFEELVQDERVAGDEVHEVTGG